MKYIFQISILLFLIGCTSETTEGSRISDCECSDLQLDPLYNHFYLTVREEPYTGACSEKNKSGILIKTIQYKAGKVDGILKEYYDNGNIKSETGYQLNKQHGDYKVYDESGSLVYHSIFHKGTQQEVLFH